MLEALFHQFRQQQLLEVKGMVGNDYCVLLTAAGRALATARNEVCQYVGPAPVSLQQYHQVVKAQTAHVQLSRESLRRAFHDLVLPDALLDQLGPSLIGHQSLFLYGGTGNGKTSIAERILRIYHDTVAGALRGGGGRPHHHAVRPRGPQRSPAATRCWIPRWVVCRAALHHGGRRAFGFMLELRWTNPPGYSFRPAR